MVSRGRAVEEGEELETAFLKEKLEEGISSSNPNPLYLMIGGYLEYIALSSASAWPADPTFLRIALVVSC